MWVAGVLFSVFVFLEGGVGFMVLDVGRKRTFISNTQIPRTRRRILTSLAET